MIYPEGNFIESSDDTPFFQIGETKYGKPIIVRTYDRAMSFAETTKLLLVSFDSTLKSNLSVGLPLDLFFYEKDSLQARPEEADRPGRPLLPHHLGRLVERAEERLQEPAGFSGELDSASPSALVYGDCKWPRVDVIGEVRRTRSGWRVGQSDGEQLHWDEFRDWSHRAADWGADYRSTLRDRPVRAQTAPGDIARDDCGVAARSRPSRWTGDLRRLRGRRSCPA